MNIDFKFTRENPMLSLVSMFVHAPGLHIAKISIREFKFNTRNNFDGLHESPIFQKLGKINTLPYR